MDVVRDEKGVSVSSSFFFYMRPLGDCVVEMEVVGGKWFGWCSARMTGGIVCREKWMGLL